MGVALNYVHLAILVDGEPCGMLNLGCLSEQFDGDPLIL